MFCFTKVEEYYKFIPYGTKLYWQVLKERKRKERQYLANKKNHSEGDKILKEKKVPKSIKKLRKKAKKLKEDDMVVDGKS
jgi:23S rRNA pseudoU1915 N3-methylase RlmH